MPRIGRIPSVTRRAKPFLKWAGGKQQLLQQFGPYFPSAFQRYMEPFLGGGAVFFHLWNQERMPEHVHLFDTNQELIDTYRVVRDQVEALIERLAYHERHHSREHYYSVRSLDRRKETRQGDVEKAARMIYLNRTCYNGLYRVNRRGEFNVPMGSYRNPRILHEETLRAASAALQGACLEARDFRSIVDGARAGDFVYFDPPYDPVSRTASFTGYTSGNFGDEDQIELAEVFAELSRRGCRCMLSNSYTPFVLELYSQFRIELVQASRAINSKGDSRGTVNEVVVVNYSENRTRTGGIGRRDADLVGNWVIG